MGGCVSGRQEEMSDIVLRFEKQLPLSKITLQDFEERVKRLVFEDDDDELSFN